MIVLPVDRLFWRVRAIRRVCAVLLVSAGAAVPIVVSAQGIGGVVTALPPAGQGTSPYPSLVQGMAPVPFTVGERLEYDVKFS